MAHRRSVVLFALVSLLAVPEVASAGTVGVQDGRLAFTAGGGEANAVRLAPGDGAVTVSDAVALPAGAGCTAAARATRSAAATAPTPSTRARATSWWTDRARREAVWVVLDDPQRLIAHEVPPERRETLPDGRTVEISSQRGGGALAMRCSSACTMSARLIVSRAASRRLGLERRVLARAAVARPVAKATRKLRDAAGKARVDVQRVRISRSGRLTSRRPG